MRPDAIVFGLYETGLGVARSLGIKGLQVIGIDHKKDIAWHSKFVQPLICPHPVNQESAFLRWIEQAFAETYGKIPVFFTSDDFLTAYSKHREALGKFFLCNMVSHQLFISISDKLHQSALATDAGVAVPLTFEVKNLNELAAITGDVRYPLFIKGKDVNSWRKHISSSTKGFQAKDKNELEGLLQRILVKNVPVIVQELIPGNDTNHYKYSAYIADSGDVLAEFTLQKIRQSPPHYGVGAVVESNYYPDLIETGRRLFKNIGYTGIGSAEFKKDQRDGKLKLIEINPRYWQQNYLPTYCGINFPYINYTDMMGVKYQSSQDYKTGVKWVNRQLDFDSFLKYRKEKQLSFTAWRRSLRGEKLISDFFWDDPMPALANIEFGLKLLKAPFYLLKRVR